MPVSAPAPLAARLRGVASSPVRDLLALTERPGVLSFAGGLPAPELFDHEGLRAAFGQALASRQNLQYATTEGNPRLRELIAARLSGRGLPTDPKDLLITSGSQQALTLVATALLDPGAVVAVEEPTYLAALQCFQLAGARIVTVASDEDGVVPESLAEVVARHRPRLFYAVPTFANPTGRTLSAERRKQIVEITRGLWVVEDDPYGELRYSGEPVAALATHDPNVLYQGSFSKIGAPGLRLGWLRVPAAIRPAVVVAKQAADLHTSTVDQAAAAAYLAAADLDAHVRRLQGAYRERRDAMLAALPGALPPGSRWSEPDGGMFIWVRLPGDMDSATALPRALDHDVAFVPGAPFYAGEPDRATLRLSFTTNTPDEIRTGIQRLAAALRA